MNLARTFKRAKKINIKTLYFNFKYLPFHQAAKLPFFISRHVYLRQLKGKVIIEGKIWRGMIEIGYENVGIFDNKRSRSVLEFLGTIIFKGGANIGHGSKISVGEEGQLIIGRNFQITAESSIVAHKRISIGDNCLFSWDVLLMDTDFHKIKDIDNKIINPAKEITIGSNVWIGSRCMIIKGTHIPANSIIASNTFLNKSLDGEGNIFGGSPVKILKSEVTWEG